MEFIRHTTGPNFLCSVEISAFRPECGGETEYHFILKPSSGGSFEQQLAQLHSCLKQILCQPEYVNARPEFIRYFLSDPMSQRQWIRSQQEFRPSCPVSVIGQSPADGTHVALWVYLREKKPAPERRENDFLFFWTTERYCTAGNVTQQTQKLLMDYEQWLRTNGCSMMGNCIRTWFYVKDIDNNYTAFAKARTEYFARIGMTDKTHYIASTGIEGTNASAGSFVTMDAFAIAGIKPAQVQYLHGLSHLSPTHIYGVTFERGTTVSFPDRKHIYISGTASIDNHGNVLFLNDVKAQAMRMLENVQVLLSEAGAGLADVAQIIVYLRNGEDYPVVRDILSGKLPPAPVVYTLGRVCRPSWLIEMECIAVIPFVQ
ncbi:MAG: Rid family hydrolase [Bacteroidales bacterium]|jgi:enamine deaminase RidA (YjgF/YER057c/UK114 family)|nr:Rid family hydrolase [Bacteroidales bacterium]